MARKIRHLLANPIELVAYAIEHPRRVLAVVVAVAVLTVVVVLSFGLGLLPEWTVLFAIAAVAGYLARRQYLRLKLFLRATASQAGSVTPGAVRVSGAARAAGGEGVQFDGSEYVAYRHRIEQRRSNRNDGSSTRVKTDTSEAVPFLIEDSTGTVLVDGHSADLVLEWDETQRDGRETRYFAGIGDGETVRVYGTAVPATQRQPQRLTDAASEGMDSLRGNDIDAYADGGSLVVTAGENIPELVVTDRSHWRVLGRSLVVFLATALVTVGLVGLGVFVAAGGSFA